MGVDAEMYVVPEGDWPTEDQVRSLACDLTEAFYPESFYINRQDPYRQHALDLREDPRRIRVNLASRYYGPGYERGDLWLILGIWTWLKMRLDPCRVFYGGDSDCIPYPELDFGRYSELVERFVEHGHKTYAGWDDPGQVIFGPKDLEVPVCDFCGGLRYVNMGGGRAVGFYACRGCGHEIRVHKDGRVEEVDRGKGFF